MPDAALVRDAHDVRLTAGAAVGVAEIWQMSDGRAAYFGGTAAAALNDAVAFKTSGQVNITKLAGIVLLRGGRVYWDHSTNTATFRKVNDRDFYVGRVVNDAASVDVLVTVNLNIDPPYDLDLLRDAYDTVPVGTQALGGFLPPQRQGGSLVFTITATSQPQKVDALSVDGFDKAANAIVEYVFRTAAGGSGTDLDFNFGIANATDSDNADDITDSLFCHLDGGSTAIRFESDDGVTEVAATDSTKTFTAGTAVANRKEIWFDMRDPADVQIYVDGELVLSATVFNINASVAVWKLLVHVEKSTGTQTGDLIIDRACARYMEQ